MCIVAQTTYSIEKFNDLSKKIETLIEKKVEIFKTICYTTRERQKETVLLAKQCDAIIVIGGENSSNTDKLYELSKKYQPNVFRLSSPDLFNKEIIKNYRKVGIVLGASTPIEQAQEVIQRMEVTEVNTIETENKAVETVEPKVEAKVEKFDYDYQKKCVEERDYEKLELYVMELHMGL